MDLNEIFKLQLHVPIVHLTQWVREIWLHVTIMSLILIGLPDIKHAVKYLNLQSASKN